MPGIDGTWVAINDAAQGGAAAATLAAHLASLGPGFEKASAVAAPKLWFLFQQQGANVIGTFHDEKVFTCEFKGTLAGNKLTILWETVFSWLNFHENGSAELILAPDGSTLAGRFASGSVSGAWRLKREVAQPHTAPVPVAPPVPHAPPVRPPPPRPSAGRGSQPYVPYHDRIIKEVWDAEHDEPLLKRLKARARVEPELKERLIRRGLAKPEEF